jgi:hypothetical protein
MKLAASIWKALSDLVAGPRRAYTDQRAQRQDLQQMAVRAQQGGATHGKRFGAAVCFYRLHGDRVECCFAEYHPASGRYTWIWEPPDWREVPGGMPTGATPVSEIARRGI